MSTVELSVEGMNCPSCANRIQKVLEKKDGVEKAEIHLATARGEVEYDPDQITIDEIIDAIKKTGYEATPR